MYNWHNTLPDQKGKVASVVTGIVATGITIPVVAVRFQLSK